MESSLSINNLIEYIKTYNEKKNIIFNFNIINDPIDFINILFNILNDILDTKLDKNIYYYYNYKYVSSDYSYTKKI